jgi:hypothetical protein
MWGDEAVRWPEQTCGPAPQAFARRRYFEACGLLTPLENQDF